jgi:hypothetical protein
MEYNFAADCLNKFSQLTPWVQALMALGAFTVILGVAYFMKETVAIIIRPFQRNTHELVSKASAPKWRDKYYRDANAG